MNILDRVILAIYMLLMVAASLYIVSIPLNIVPESDINGVVSILYSNWYYALALGLLLAFISIKLLISGISIGRKQRSGIIKFGEFGDISISVDTFESLAMRAVKQVSGIKDAKVKIHVDKEDLAVYTRLQVLPEINIPKVTGEVQDRIKSHIESTTEVGVKEVKVYVDNIASSSSARVE